jgi:hypothetical protein
MFVMFPFDDAKIWCFDAALQDGGKQTFNLSNKDVHISSIQPAPDPVKQDRHLSPRGRETTSIPVSKFSFDWYSDAVDWNPGVNRFSTTVDQNEYR